MMGWVTRTLRKVFSNHHTSGHTLLRCLSTKAELKFVEDVLKTTKDDFKEIYYMLRKPATRRATLQEKGPHITPYPQIDCTPHNVLNLKANSEFLEVQQDKFATASNLSTNWRRMIRHWDPQRSLEALISLHHGKEDTLIYTVTHDHLMHLVFDQLIGKEAYFIEMANRSNLQTHLKQSISHVDPFDYQGLEKMLSSCQGKYRFIQSYSDISAAATKDQIMEIEHIISRTQTIHIFRDVEELILTSYLLGKGNSLTEVLSLPTLVQSSLNLIYPGSEVRYISGPWAVISWFRQLLEKSGCITNLPVHVGQPLLQALKTPEYAQKQLYLALENAVQLRKRLVELPCGVRGDTFNTVLEIENAEQIHAVEAWLKADGIHTASSNERKQIKISSHANNTNTDLDRVAQTLSEAFVAHAETQRLM